MNKRRARLPERDRRWREGMVLHKDDFKFVKIILDCFYKSHGEPRYQIPVVKTIKIRMKNHVCRFSIKMILSFVKIFIDCFHKGHGEPTYQILVVKTIEIRIRWYGGGFSPTRMWFAMLLEKQ